MGEKWNVILEDGYNGDSFYLKLTKEQIALFNFLNSQKLINELVTLKLVDDVDFKEIK